MKSFAVILLLGLISLTIQNEEHCRDYTLSYEKKRDAILKKESIIKNSYSRTGKNIRGLFHD